MPWDTLPESIRETWKIDPALVLEVKNRSTKTLQKFEAFTETHRYLWTFMPSRWQWTVKKTDR